SLLFLGATVLLGILFSLLYIPLPRLFLGSFVYVMFVNVAILLDASSGKLFSFVIGIGYSVAVLLVSLIIFALIRMKIGRIALLALLVMSGIFISVPLFSDSPSINNQASQAFKENTNQEDNPGKTGGHKSTFFTNGSGDDMQREEFGASVDELTPTVDASELTNWKKDRKEFWGYDATNLPLNGRVWMPDGNGPFPIVLMVHGNHVMEEFSTDGYDYLGELLASRG